MTPSSQISSDEPLVSVVIPVFGKVDYTLRCLRSIAANLPASTIEIIVVDDCSPDDTLEQLSSFTELAALRIIKNDQNLGFIRSCNRGATAARGKYLHFLNNDTEVMFGWLDALLETFQQHVDVGLVGSKLIFPDGALQEAGGIVWKDGSAWNYGRGQDPTASRFNFVRDTDYCSGASILIEKSLFDALGQFDERYVPAYCEDSSLAFAVRQAGKRVLYQPKSEVIHYEGVSSGTDLTSGVKSYQVENQKKFLALWGDELKRDHFENSAHIPLACSRSGKKPWLLIIDHYVPQHDRDAGSRTIHQFIQFFVSAGYVVKFWPDNLYNDPDHTPALQAIGVEVIYGPEYLGGFDRWMSDHGQYLSIVLLSRPHISIKYLGSLTKKTDAKLVYYGHDLHFLRLRRQAALDWKMETLVESASLEKMEREIWSKVDVVVYPTEEEVEIVKAVIQQTGLRCDVATVPAYSFTDFADNACKNLSERQGLIFVAGFQHPPNIDAAIWFCREVMPLLRVRHSGIKLSLVGSNPSADVIALQSEVIEVTGSVSDDELKRRYETARVAVVPLRYGGGIKGKVIEALRFGLPCVTTTTGSQGLEDAMEFLAVAGAPDDFVDAISELIESDRLFRRRSSAGVEYVRRNFNPERLRNSLASITGSHH
jgi:GT2 family glycosyltransferase